MLMAGASGDALTTRTVGSGTPVTVGVACWAKVTTAEADVATISARTRSSPARLPRNRPETEFRSNCFIGLSSLDPSGAQKEQLPALLAYRIPPLLRVQQHARPRRGLCGA